VKCPNCGATFKGGRGRCPACGYRVQSQKLVRRCPECRARVAEGAKTCLMCGTPLEGGKSFVPQVSLSMVPPAPLLGAALAIVLLVALWLIKPWRGIHLGTYYTPTATATFTFTPTSTATPTVTPTAPPTETPTPQVTTYIVRTGDTLSLIAGQFGITVDSIMEVNGLTDYTIQVGQELLIPVEVEEPTSSPAAAETPEAEATVQPAATRTYVVRSGDSLSAIAQRFGISQQALMEANDITNPDAIREGQELVIPGPATSTETPGIGGPPTPTVSNDFAYPEPILLAPPDGSEFREEDAEEPILLNWLSVGLLGEDEWYSVSVRYVTDEEGAAQETVELTKATSYRVPVELRPSPEAESFLFEWQVSVVRLVETEVEGNPDIVPIGRESETMAFYWY
jgi:LysM repeat protein